MSRRTLLLGLLVPVALFASSSCQRSTPQATAPQGQQGPTSSERSSLYIFPGINHLANLSQAGFVGRVIEVSPPRWNSDDGQPWEPEGGSELTATAFRDAKIEVLRIIFETEVFPLEAGEIVSIRLWGDGTPTGDRVGLPETNSWVFENQIEGEVVGGAVLLLLVGNEPFPTQSGWEDANRIAGNFQGNWTVRNDNAESINPKRTAPLESLIGRILQERQVGKKPERDRNTRANPLG